MGHHHRLTRGKMNTKELVEDRSNQHGLFSQTSSCTIGMYAILCGAINESGKNADDIPAIVLEAIHMICNKMSRIACGDPVFIDHWKDIQGYAYLVEEYLSEQADLTEGGDSLDWPVEGDLDPYLDDVEPIQVPETETVPPHSILFHNCDEYPCEYYTCDECRECDCTNWEENCVDSDCGCICCGPHEE